MATGRVPTTANSPLTAKGDLFGYSTAPARLAVGNDGEQIVADSSTSTGLRYQPTMAAGKNAIINGGFDNWQRGTSFTVASNADTYTADRFLYTRNGSGATVTVSRQANTAAIGTNQPSYFMRCDATVAGSGGAYQVFKHRIEDVSTYAGQTVTVSFYAKAGASLTMPAVEFNQYFGSGGSSTVNNTLVSNQAITTSWARYSYTVTLGNMSGKTIGTGSYIEMVLWMPSNATFTFDVWGVQAELGSVATQFTRAGGTIQGELSACQRYYYLHASGDVQAISNGYMYSATSAIGVVQFPVTMRTAPTSAIVTGTNYYKFQRNGATDDFNSLTLDIAGKNATNIYNNTEISGTAGHAGNFQTANASAFVAFQAEL
jgi:hypothetical protein